MEILMGKVQREKDRLNFEALSPSPESMSGLSASLWGFPQTKALGCWGLRGEGGGKMEGPRGRQTSSGRLWMLLQFRQQCWHLMLIISYPDLFILTENNFHCLHWWSLFWNSWEVLLSNTVLISIFTLVRLSLGIPILQLWAWFPESPSSSSLTPAGEVGPLSECCQLLSEDKNILVTSSDNLPREHPSDKLRQSPTLLCGERMLFRTRYYWLFYLQCHHTSFILFN